MKFDERFFEVKIPCSTANLGPGFDSVGMALNRYLTLRFSPAEQLEICACGDHLDGVPLDEENVIIQVMKQAFAKKGLALPPCHLEAESEIPLIRGLGSSAAAIVGGLVAANHMLGSPWSKEELLQMGTSWEGHPDNIGASLYGGVVIGSWDGDKAEIITCEPPDLPILAVIPRQPLSTKLARAALPDTYSRAEAILSSSRANLLVAALFSKRWDLLKVAMQDKFHQPYRESLVPGLRKIQEEAINHGAYGVALSGAGPTLIAFAEETERLRQYLEQTFIHLEIPAEIVELKACRDGATVRLTSMENRSKVFGNVKGAKA